MMRRGIIIMVVLAMVSSIMTGSASADTYTIGEKRSELQPDAQEGVWFDHEHGWLYTKVDYKNHATLLFDNNESTGINTDFSPGHSIMPLIVVFHEPMNVTNITVKPYFGIGACVYTLKIVIENYEFTISELDNLEKVIDINATINGLSLSLESFGSNHFSFSDIIINYTPPPVTDLSDLWDEIDALKDIVSQLQGQMDDIAREITDINNTVNNLNDTRRYLLENITTLWNAYSQLNSSLVELTTEFNNLNISTPENITIIEHNLTEIYQDITYIEQIIKDLPDTNMTSVTKEINDRVNKTATDVTSISKEIEGLKGSIPEEFNASSLEDLVTQLQDQNQDLRTDLEELEDEVQKKDTAIEEQQRNNLGFIGVILALIALLLALMAIIMKAKARPEPAASQYDDGGYDEGHRSREGEGETDDERAEDGPPGEDEVGPEDDEDVPPEDDEDIPLEDDEAVTTEGDEDVPDDERLPDEDGPDDERMPDEDGPVEDPEGPGAEEGDRKGLGSEEEMDGEEVEPGDRPGPDAPEDIDDELRKLEADM